MMEKFVSVAKQQAELNTFVRSMMLVLFMTGLVLALSSQAFAVAGQLRISSGQMGKEHQIELSKNKSLVIELPADVKEMVISNPAVVNGVMRSKRRAIIQSAELGEANVLFLNANGTPIAVIDVTVRQSSKGLEATIGRLIPNSKIQVQNFNGKLVLSGTADSNDDVNRALSIAAQFASSPEDVASVVDVSGAQQVMLKVTVAEVQRETVKQLGINLSGNLDVGGVKTALVSAGSLGGVSGVVAPNSLTAGFSLGNLSIDATIKALERRGALRTLAEPTLTAISGAEAEFLAGGEYPVPIGIDNGEVAYGFKKFGIELKFKPTVHSGGLISMQVETSVSEINAEGGYVAGPVTIPATKNRKAKTSVKLQTGSTLAIAGLIEEKQRQRFNEIPGLGKIPILGTLFRSRDFIRSETELLILVTPYLASAGTKSDFDLPTDNFEFADDASAYFLGHMEKMYGVGNKENGNLQGSIGFVLD